VITHLEPDILKSEVKRALGSITTNKASGGDGIPVELFRKPFACHLHSSDASELEQKETG